MGRKQFCATKTDSRSSAHTVHMAHNDRATAWSITINNPTPDDEEAIALARQRGWKVEGQLEKGENGTPHYQLIARTPQVRFSAVKKQFPRAHIEVARNAAALAQYVHKEDTREAELPIGSAAYPSMSKFFEMIALKANHGHRSWTWDDKDALDSETSAALRRAHFYRSSEDRSVDSNPLKYLDELVDDLIAEGYYVESIASNPSVRTSWKKHWRAIIYRAIQQTDRQTDSVQIPTISSSDLEHNHADDNSPSPSSRRILEGIYGPESEGNPSSEEHRPSDSQGDHHDR